MVITKENIGIDKSLVADYHSLPFRKDVMKPYPRVAKHLNSSATRHTWVDMKHPPISHIAHNPPYTFETSMVVRSNNHMHTTTGLIPIIPQDILLQPYSPPAAGTHG
ncbi:hypothetical protein [Bacteroides acidifaciens]|uniref:hypothetical protein n=1 Tax=Bacteroides acidifaciens TaxID=85831 RepID=UPI003F68F48F